MKIILLRSKSTSLTEIVNLLILVTFKINDFIGQYLKLVVLQGYTVDIPICLILFPVLYRRA